MASRGLLQTCADMVLVCADAELPANRYTMLSTCSVLAELVAETECGRGVPLPGIPAAKIAKAIDVIHGICKPAGLSLAETADVQDGFEYLGCTLMKNALAARMWACLQGSSDVAVVLEHAPRLLHHQLYQKKYLNLHKMLAPSWNDARALLRSVDVTMPLALFLLDRLTLYFPAGLVYRALLERLPADVKTFQNAMSLLGHEGLGDHFHPTEMAETLDHIAALFPAGSKCLRTLRAALTCYDSLGHPNMHGSVVSFVLAPKRSVLLSINDPFRGGRVIGNKYMKLTVDAVHGLRRCELWPVKFAEQARNLYVRIMLYRGTEVEETWHNFLNFTGYVVTQQPTGDKTTWLKHIRLDMFYDTGDPRTSPMY